MYKWIIVLMGYIEKMVCWDVRAMRTDRMKIVIQEAAGLGERKGTENLNITNQESGEDYARKVLDFLEGARKKNKGKRKKKMRRFNGTCLPGKRERGNREERRKERR